jgi:hypothetical protein
VALPLPHVLYRGEAGRAGREERRFLRCPSRKLRREPDPVPRGFQAAVLFETGSRYVAQGGLELEIFLLPPLTYWDDRRVPSCLA